MKPRAAAMLLAAVAFAGSRLPASAQGNAVDAAPPSSYSSFGTGNALLAHAVVMS